MNILRQSMKIKVKEFRNLILLIPVFYICYILVANIGAILSNRSELFPVFNWSLFTYVSDVRKLCELEVLSIDGVRLDRPTRFYELRNRFRAGRDVTVLKLVNRSCNAKSEGRENTFEELRKVLESSFLSDKNSVEYRLVIHTYNPIARWRDGSVISTRVLGEYQTGSISN